MLSLKVPQHRNTLRQLKSIVINNAWKSLKAVDILETVFKMFSALQRYNKFFKRNAIQFEQNVQCARRLANVIKIELHC